MASYDYIFKHYGVRPKIGGRVEHAVVEGKGTIMREAKSHGHYVRVRFDGQKHPSFCHPLELEFLGPEEN